MRLSGLFGISNHSNKQVACVLISCSHFFQQSLLNCVTPAGNKSIANSGAWRWDFGFSSASASARADVFQFGIGCLFVRLFFNQQQFRAGPATNIPPSAIPTVTCKRVVISALMLPNIFETCIPAVWPRLLINSVQQTSLKEFSVGQRKVFTLKRTTFLI